MKRKKVAGEIHRHVAKYNVKQKKTISCYGSLNILSILCTHMLDSICILYRSLIQQSKKKLEEGVTNGTQRT